MKSDRSAYILRMDGTKSMHGLEYGTKQTQNQTTNPNQNKNKNDKNNDQITNVNKNQNDNKCRAITDHKWQNVTNRSPHLGLCVC